MVRIILFLFFSDREQSVSPKQSPVSRPGAKHKHAPKVISAIENTFDPLSNIETGIELGSECQEVIFEKSFETKRELFLTFVIILPFFTDTLPIYAVF